MSRDTLPLAVVKALQAAGATEEMISAARVAFVALEDVPRRQGGRPRKYAHRPARQRAYRRRYEIRYEIPVPDALRYEIRYEIQPPRYEIRDEIPVERPPDAGRNRFRLAPIQHLREHLLEGLKPMGSRELPTALERPCENSVSGGRGGRWTLPRIPLTKSPPRPDDDTFRTRARLGFAPRNEAVGRLIPVFPQHLGRCATPRLARLGAEPRRVPLDEARAVAADEFVPLDGRRPPGTRRSLNSMARKTLLAGRQDFPDEPRGAPFFQWARQVRQQASHDRQHVRFDVTALGHE